MNQLTHLLIMLRLERPNISEVKLSTNIEGKWSVASVEGGHVQSGMWFNTPDDAIENLEASLRERATKRRTELEANLKAVNDLLNHPPLVEND